MASLGCTFEANNTPNVGTMTGLSYTVGEDLVFPFTTDEDANYSVDEIGCLSNRVARVAFTSDGGRSRTIAYTGTNYSTISSAPILGGFEDTEDNTKAELVERYLGYLLNLNGVLRGYVTDINGDPIQGATVSLDDYSNNTNQYGLCAVEVPAGSYTVTCTHPNYTSFTYPSQIDIGYNNTYTYWLNIELTSTSIDEPEHEDRITRVYPNPCTSNSSVEFFVKTSSDVDISLYNILGQKVSTLIHEYVKPGYHEVSFENAFKNKTKLAAGIYFMKLQTDSDTNIQKLLIIE